MCHRQIVVLEVEFGLGKGAVAPLVLGPLGEVVVDHFLGGDAGEAEDAHHHVFGVVAHVEDVAIGMLVLPVRVVEGDKDHDGVDKPAEQVEEPYPLGGGEAPAEAAADFAVADLVDDGVVGDAVLVARVGVEREKVVAGNGHVLELVVFKARAVLRVIVVAARQPIAVLSLV